MKHMFEMDEQGGLTIAPQVLMIKEFTELAKNRGNSPYMRMDDEERWNYIKDDVLYMFPKWEVDQHINACIDKYREMSRTRSMDTLESAWKAQTSHCKIRRDW
jgi:hypothetical protein